MKLHMLLPPSGTKKRRKRLGRGDSSGSGNYCGKGIKGAKSRAGRAHFLGFEGGQMPLYRRVPKKGFTPPLKERYQEVNLSSLNRFKDGEEITPEVLCNQGIIKKRNEKVKILGNGELGVSLSVQAHKFSKKAKEEITKKGGKTIEIRTKAQSGKDTNRENR